jgi:hypothetical protein
MYTLSQNNYYIAKLMDRLNNSCRKHGVQYETVISAKENVFLLQKVELRYTGINKSKRYTKNRVQETFSSFPDLITRVQRLMGFVIWYRG